MKAYKVLTPYNYSQTHIVIADNMAEVEKTFLEEYEFTTIEKIELIANYVLIQNKNSVA